MLQTLIIKKEQSIIKLTTTISINSTELRIGLLVAKQKHYLANCRTAALVTKKRITSISYGSLKGKIIKIPGRICGIERRQNAIW